MRNIKWKRKLQNQVSYSDIHRDFVPQLKDDIKIVTDTKAIEQSVSGILQTKKGECPLDPEFGCDISEQLFENMHAGTQYLIEESVREALEKYEPRIKDIQIKVIPLYDQNTLLVTISYFIISVNETQTLEYELSGK